MFEMLFGKEYKNCPEQKQQMKYEVWKAPIVMKFYHNYFEIL